MKFITIPRLPACYYTPVKMNPLIELESEMPPKPRLLSPLTLPLALALSMTTWLATALSHRVPHQPDGGMVWVYVPALCAVPGDASDCRPTAVSTIRTFDSRESCVAHLDAALSDADNPRFMGSCLRRPEA